MTYVLQLQPVPEEFVSQDMIFRRRLRVRKAAPGETKEEIAAKLAIKKHRSLVGRAGTGTKTGNLAALTQSTGTEPKRWLVEAAGTLFEVQPSLRPLKEVSQRFYIAVPIELEKKILNDGFHVKRRLSIPCSGSPQQALAAFAKNEQREKKAKEGDARQNEEGATGLQEEALQKTRQRQEVEALSQGTKAIVLAVTILPEMKIDVVAHRDGGFQIKSQSLPGSCFQRAKRTDKD